MLGAGMYTRQGSVGELLPGISDGKRREPIGEGGRPPDGKALLDCVMLPHETYQPRLSIRAHGAPMFVQSFSSNSSYLEIPRGEYWALPFERTLNTDTKAMSCPGGSVWYTRRPSENDSLPVPEQQVPDWSRRSICGSRAELVPGAGEKRF